MHVSFVAPIRGGIMRRFLLCVLLFSCKRDLDLPSRSPGSISGRLVVSQPGSPDPVPAAGASVQLLESNVAAVANAEGRFFLSPITVTTGSLLVRFDPQPDGSFALQ